MHLSHCPRCQGFNDDEFQEHTLDMLHRLEAQMTAVSADQAHLNADVSALVTAFAAVVQELKDQANSGNKLDFASADALVASVQAEATADAPATVTPAPVDTPPADESPAPDAGDPGTPEAAAPATS